MSALFLSPSCQLEFIWILENGEERPEISFPYYPLPYTAILAELGPAAVWRAKSISVLPSEYPAANGQGGVWCKLGEGEGAGLEGCIRKLQALKRSELC